MFVCGGPVQSIVGTFVHGWGGAHVYPDPCKLGFHLLLSHSPSQLPGWCLHLLPSPPQTAANYVPP